MSDNYLPTDYQSFIHKSRYARWLEAEGRRESWGETVTRYMDNLVKPSLTRISLINIQLDFVSVVQKIVDAVL